jgi:N-acetylglucosamine-6-phosphate deacetylase
MIEIHTHGIGGFDTRYSSVEHVLKIAYMHGSDGVSHIVPAVYSAIMKTMRENMAVIREAMELQSETGVEGKSARIVGIHLEGPFLNPKMCGALDASSFIDPDEFSLKKLIEGYEDIVKIITLAPELEGALKLIKQISDAGIIVSMGHSDASYADAEAGHRAGACGITHLFNAMRGIHHREPGLAGYGLMNKDIYIELIADPFHLDSRMIEFIFSAKDPDRIILISDTVKETKTFPEITHGITDEAEKLLGGSMTISESSKRLMQMGLDELTIEKTVFVNPARYLNVEL